MILYSRTGEAFTVTHVGTQGKYHLRKKPCFRCGGAGGAEAWRQTGWTCYRCEGNGIDPKPEKIKLYTPEQNAKLDARAATAAANRAAKKAEADRLEQDRRDRERSEIISANEGFIARIDAELEHGEVEVLRSVREWIVDRAKEPTDRQVETVNQIIDRNTKDRARRAGASHVGALKERREFTLTLVYLTHRPADYNGNPFDSYWSLFTDENGCKIACKSAFRTLGLQRVRDHDDPDYGQIIKGQTIRVKATVVEHTHDKRGEPVTYINRPKAI